MTLPCRGDTGPAPQTLEIVVKDAACLPAVQRAITDGARRLGFGLVQRTKLLTAVSELSRNMLEHGGGGTVSIEVLEEGHRCGTRVTFADQGPGIADIDRAMQDGYSSGRGMGLGLPGSRRLAHEFSIETGAGRGTRIVIVVWKR